MSLRDELQGRLAVASRLRGTKRVVRNLIESEEDLDQVDLERRREYSRKAQAKRRRMHPERVRELVDRWRAANPDKVREMRKAWKANNPDKARAMWAKTARRRYHDDPESARAKQRAYYQQNRDAILKRERERRNARREEINAKKRAEWAAKRDVKLAKLRAYRARRAAEGRPIVKKRKVAE